MVLRHQTEPEEANIVAPTKSESVSSNTMNSFMSSGNFLSFLYFIIN